MKENKIDFVILWVDGNDPKWQKEKKKYEVSKSSDTDTRTIRYRDWDNLRYWFRGVEKFAPWVNNIFFVTWGHLPSWLNTNHKKLKIINHKDYMPKEYLPTFNCNPLENNLHRIKGLQENFVYFNDDMFIINKVEPTDFFRNNLPCDSATLNATISHRENANYIEAVDMGIVNDHFNKKEVLTTHFHQWFNLKYGSGLVRTLCLLPWKEFPGILATHIPTSLKKSTYKELWDKEYEVLDETSKHKFRYALDVNQWLFRDWQLVTGQFYPRSISFGKSFALNDDETQNQKIYHYITSQKYKVICVNDMAFDDSNFLKAKDDLNQAFDKILSEKSDFEL